MLLVGYRDDKRQPGGGVFLIRNSSGPFRGGMLSYEYAKAYMNDAIWIDYAGANEGGPSRCRHAGHRIERSAAISAPACSRAIRSAL